MPTSWSASARTSRRGRKSCSSTRSSTSRSRARWRGPPTRQAPAASTRSPPICTSARRRSSSARRRSSGSRRTTSSTGRGPGARRSRRSSSSPATPSPGLFAGLDPALVGKAEPRDLRELYLPLVTERLTNWVIVPAPNEGWATDGLRRARPRAPLAGRRDGDAARRGRSGAGVAGPRRHAPRALGRPQRARLRRRPLSGAGNGSRRRPPRGVPLDVRDVRDDRAGSSTCRTSPPRRSSRPPTGDGRPASCGRPIR